MPYPLLFRLTVGFSLKGLVIGLPFLRFMCVPLAEKFTYCATVIIDSPDHWYTTPALPLRHCATLPVITVPHPVSMITGFCRTHAYYCHYHYTPVLTYPTFCGDVIPQLVYMVLLDRALNTLIFPVFRCRFFAAGLTRLLCMCCACTRCCLNNDFATCVVRITERINAFYWRARAFATRTAVLLTDLLLFVLLLRNALPLTLPP